MQKVTSPRFTILNYEPQSRWRHRRRRHAFGIISRRRALGVRVPRARRAVRVPRRRQPRRALGLVPCIRPCAVHSCAAGALCSAQHACRQGSVEIRIDGQFLWVETAFASLSIFSRSYPQGSLLFTSSLLYIYVVNMHIECTCLINDHPLHIMRIPQPRPPPVPLKLNEYRHCNFT